MNNIYSSHEEVPQQMSDSLGHFTVKLNVNVNLLMGILQCGCHVPTKINSLHCSMQLVTFISTDPTNLKSCCSFISFGFHFFLFIMKQNHPVISKRKTRIALHLSLHQQTIRKVSNSLRGLNCRTRNYKVN